MFVKESEAIIYIYLSFVKDDRAGFIIYLFDTSTGITHLVDT